MMRRRNQWELGDEPARGRSDPLAAGGHAPPDWVILGFPFRGQVAIIASTELTRAELEAERDSYTSGYDLFDPYRYKLSSWRYALTAELRRYVLITADTYVDALRSLSDQWTPEPSRRELPSG